MSIYKYSKMYLYVLTIYGLHLNKIFLCTIKSMRHLYFVCWTCLVTPVGLAGWMKFLCISICRLHFNNLFIFICSYISTFSNSYVYITDNNTNAILWSHFMWVAQNFQRHCYSNGLIRFKLWRKELRYLKEMVPVSPFSGLRPASVLDKDWAWGDWDNLDILRFTYQ